MSPPSTPPQPLRSARVVTSAQLSSSNAQQSTQPLYSVWCAVMHKRHSPVRCTSFRFMCAVQQSAELIQESDPVIVLHLNARVDICQAHV